MGPILKEFAYGAVFVVLVVGGAVVLTDTDTSMAVGWVVFGTCVVLVKLVVQTLLHYRAAPADPTR